MSFREATQNLILVNEAEARGHRFGPGGGRREIVVLRNPLVRCLLCSRTIDVLAEDAKKYVQANRPILRCEGEVRELPPAQSSPPSPLPPDPSSGPPVS